MDRKKPGLQREAAQHKRSNALPATLFDDAPFWRGERRLTKLQLSGLIIYVACAATLVFLTLGGSIAKPWHERIVSGLFNWLIALTILGGFVAIFRICQVLGSRRQKQKQRMPPKH